MVLSKGRTLHAGASYYFYPVSLATNSFARTAAPLIRKVVDILYAARNNDQDNRALADSFLVFLSLSLGNAVANQRAYQAAGHCAECASRERADNWPSDYQTYSGQNKCGPYGNQGRERCTRHSANGCSDRCTFRCLCAKLTVREIIGSSYPQQNG
jgi:hypothetical protein